MILRSPSPLLDAEARLRELVRQLRSEGVAVVMPSQRLEPAAQLSSIVRQFNALRSSSVRLDGPLLHGEAAVRDAIREFNLVGFSEESGGGSGGGGGEDVQAVHWDDASSRLQINSLTAAESPLWSFATWFKQPSNVPDRILSGFFAVDPEGVYASYAEADLATPLGAPTQVQFSLGDTDGNFLASHNSNGTVAHTANAWNCYMGSVDGTDETVHAWLNTTNAAGFVTGFSNSTPIGGNGLPFWIGNIFEPQIPYDMAVFLMWYGLCIELLECDQPGQVY